MIEEAHMVAIAIGKRRQSRSANLEMNKVMGTLAINPEIKKNDFLLKLTSKEYNQ